MTVMRIACAVLAATLVPASALADDPRDPAMRSSAARERDRETIRRLNLQELARVRERDARYAQGWRAARENRLAAGDHERAMARYARDRANYEREMARWRRAVAACRSGDYSACD